MMFLLKFCDFFLIFLILARVVEYGYRILLWFDLHIFAQRVFTSMHFADGFIQRGLHCIESVHFYQFVHVHFLGIEPMILRLSNV